MSQDDAGGTEANSEAAAYAEAVRTLLAKIKSAGVKLEEVKAEQDLDLRVDLIEMDLRLMEAEADTLTSRGNHLTLMAKSGQAKVHQSLLDISTKLK